VGSLAIFTPGAFAMFLLAHQHERVRQLQWLHAMVRGIVAGFIGVLVSVTIQLGLHSLTDWKTVALAIGSVLVLLVVKTPGVGHPGWSHPLAILIRLRFLWRIRITPRWLGAR
jgi:chromate transport protein ChrA